MKTRTVSEPGDIFVVYEYLPGKCGIETCHCCIRYYTMRDNTPGIEAESMAFDDGEHIATKVYSFAKTHEEAYEFVNDRRRI